VLQGLYPVVREDAAQLAALQIQAEHGAALVDSPEEFESALEQYLTKQVHCLAGTGPCLYGTAVTHQRIRVSAQLFVYVTNLRCLFTFERDGTSSRQWGVSCKEMHSPLQCAGECPMYTCTQHETHSTFDIELEFAIN